VRHVWLDGGYTAATVRDAAVRHHMTIEVVGGPKAPSGGFRVQPRQLLPPAVGVDRDPCTP
jgi:hypothetical protein